jgi:uncharacterized integral membrane protein
MSMTVFMMHNQQPILPDAGGVMLVAGCWAPLLAVHFNAALVGLLMSILVSCLAVVDYGMKIYFKAKQLRDVPKGDTDDAPPQPSPKERERDSDTIEWTENETNE